MDELKLGNLLLAALFGLPGYIFILILTKYSFKYSRGFGSKTAHLLAAFVFSTILVVLFDSNAIHNFLFSCLFPHHHIIGPPTELEVFFQNIRFSQAVLSTLFKDQAPDNINLIVVWFLLCIGGFAIVCAVLLSIFINLINWYSKFNATNAVLFCGVFFKYLFKKTKFYCRTESIRKRHLRKKLEEKPKATPPSTPELSKLGQLAIKAITVLAFIIAIVIIVMILTVAAIVFTLFIISLGSDLIVNLYTKALSLFQHPSEELFEPKKFKWRSGLPLVEIFTDGERINKGMFVRFLPKNSEEIGGITISDVIQYTKEDGKDFFEPESRKVYMFPNGNSQLTVFSENITDINVSFVRYTDFKWDFRVTGPHSVINQKWYLGLILQRHKCLFDFKKFNAWIDSKYAPYFFLEVLRLIDANYDFLIYEYRRKELTVDLLNCWRPYRLDLKKKFSLLSQEEQEQVQEARIALAKYIVLMRKKFRPIRWTAKPAP